MGKYLLRLEVELPEGFTENAVDNAIADLLYERFDGSLIDSKEYEKLTDEE